MSRLQARNLGVDLGGRPVLAGLDVTIPQASFVGLIGPNGAGKSTLMRALSGLIPFSGGVLVGGQSVRDLSIRQRALRIAYVAQSRDIAWPVTVEELVALGRLPHRAPFTGPSWADRAVIDRIIGEMELGTLRGRLATELSGGETARVLIARALAQETDIIIADEPTAGLDPAHQMSLMQTFQRLARAGRTVIASLHELGLAARWCDRLVLLDRGRVAADGAPDAVLSPLNLKAIYGVEAFLGSDAGGLLLVPTGLAT